MRLEAAGLRPQVSGYRRECVGWVLCTHAVSAAGPNDNDHGEILGRLGWPRYPRGSGGPTLHAGPGARAGCHAFALLRKHAVCGPRPTGTLSQAIARHPHEETCSPPHPGRGTPRRTGHRWVSLELRWLLKLQLLRVGQVVRGSVDAVGPARRNTECDLPFRRRQRHIERIAPNVAGQTVLSFDDEAPIVRQRAEKSPECGLVRG